MQIVLLVRKKNQKAFSIEGVFKTIYSVLLSNQLIKVKWIEFPQFSSIKGIMQNLIYAYKIKADIYHITGDIHYLALALPSSKTILTIHDCVTLKSKSNLKYYILKKLWFDWPAKKARIITVISEKTKEELLSFVEVDPKKIVVVPNPTNTRFQYVRKDFNSDLPTILQVGTKSNKNLIRVAKALKGITCKLVIIGKVDNEQKDTLTKNGIQYKVYYNISDDEMKLHYERADMLIFASLYEGFGLPIIEAQSIGRPVVTSNISPMKEIAGSGAVFVNPYQVQSIREGVLSILNNENQRKKLVGSGLENVNRFQKEKVTNQYLSIYRTMCD